ncbi:hypothetical protein [Hyphomicrobium sp.]|uniref:hypothetical protein n=1 Tax=Hyphomicrobium sp. TaxID=82 RepID=UPI0025BD38CB|nr:hypothetical protein [Hyphomicrobium sp.]
MSRKSRKLFWAPSRLHGLLRPGKGEVEKQGRFTPDLQLNPQPLSRGKPSGAQSVNVNGIPLATYHAVMHSLSAAIQSIPDEGLAKKLRALQLKFDTDLLIYTANYKGANRLVRPRR